MRESGPKLLLIKNKLVDELYVEAMVLADEVRAYLQSGAPDERSTMDAVDRVQFSCEALKITTRLMHVIAWLLTQRAVARGEIEPGESRTEKYRLGDAAPSDRDVMRAFPGDMQVLIAASESLYTRALRLEEQMLERPDPIVDADASPVRDLLHMLETQL
jgi:regulator of CtrA degradation